MIRPTLGLFLVASVTMLSAGSCLGESPHRGGTLTQLVEAEPNTLDCHAGGTSYVLELLAPHYSTLLRFDADHYPKIEGDVAQSWTVSSDRLTYTFKLRPNVLFHDGTPLTAEDIKATYDRLRNPPPGVTSVRQGQFKDISAIDVVDPLTISFRLSQPNDSMPVTFASPWNCIYSAKKLSEDAKFPETHVLGTGPFVFIEYEKGSHFLAKRFDRYFRQGEPYLDEYRSIFVSGAGVVSALAGGQADATFLYVAPPDVERIKAARGDRTRFETAPLNVFQFVTLNTKKAPLDDVRVRRALNLAIDRRLGEKELSRITILRNFGSIMPPSSAFALTPRMPVSPANFRCSMI